MAAKRLTRKEIVQQDSIRRTLTETSHWAIEHGHLLLGGFLVLVVATLAVLLYQNYRESSTEELQVAFSEALDIFHAPINEPVAEAPANSEGSEAVGGEEAGAGEAAAGEGEAEVPAVPVQSKYQFATEQEKFEKALAEFDRIADSYSGYRLGETAGYYSALAKIELGRTDEAKAGLDLLIAEARYPDVRNLARTARSQIAADSGEYDNAVQLLLAAVEDESSNFPVQFLRYRIAETYQTQGRIPEALEAFRKITTEHAGTEEARQAQSKVSELELRLGPAEKALETSGAPSEVQPAVDGEKPQ